MNELLYMLAERLQQIADETADVQTSSDLNELVDKIVETTQQF